MREYAKVSPQFWVGHTGRQIKQQGIETQITALYLLSCPHATMLGIYYLPISFIAHETGVNFEAAQKSLQSLCDLGFCSYDEELEYIWVHEMASFQIGNALKPNDNRVKGINDDYRELPDLPFLQDFYDKYADAFLLETTRKNRLFLKATAKPLLSQEQEQEQEKEQEQEQDQEQEQKKYVVEPARPRSASEDPVQQIFDHWKKILQHPNAILDSKRKAVIRKALQAGYTVEQLCTAITGCSCTPHNMGQNDRGQRYDGLHVILRDADQIDRFIRNANHPPQPVSATNNLALNNQRAAQNWLNQKTQERKTYDQQQ